MGGFDQVNSPAHYNKPGAQVEAIDAIKAALGDEGFKAYLRGSAMKYIWRCDAKGKMLEDIQKAKWFLTRLEKELG